MKALKLTSNFELPVIENNNISNLTIKLEELKTQSKYNRSHIFKRAIYIKKTTGLSWSEALTQSWGETKSFKLKIKSELEEVESKLRNYYTPKQYHNTLEWQLEDMAKSLKHGIKIY